jgi:hypothetical protein
MDILTIPLIFTAPKVGESDFNSGTRMIWFDYSKLRSEKYCEYLNQGNFSLVDFFTWSLQKRRVKNSLYTKPPPGNEAGRGLARKDNHNVKKNY